MVAFGGAFRGGEPQAPASVVGWRLGEILVARTGVAPDAIERALAKQREEGGLIGEILVALKLCDEDQLALALSLQSEMPYLRDLPRAEDIPIEFLEKVPINFARQRIVLPVGRDATNRVMIAIADPHAVDVIDACAVLLGEAVEPVVSAGHKIIDHINKTYPRVRGNHELEEGTKKDGDSEEEDYQSEELVDMLDANDEQPIIRWVNSLMFQAARDRASDIHIEPSEKDIIVRYRIDGNLREAKRAPKKFQNNIIARVKIMAGLNIAEKRLPQDGRIRRKMAGKDVDMRVATVPVSGGERITIRILDRSSVLLGLADIGFAEDQLDTINHVIQRPHGIMLVTGPTGSGKTTTLYACLSSINKPNINILTVEDPVEYQLEGISQTQVNSKIELTFAAGLRSFLRHDPDVIMVGEIRDRETAETAITASLTGHFVFSTVHTNDAAGGITRLVDMGIEPFLVASSLVCLLAQRLVRRPCVECARPVRPSEETLRELGLDARTFYAGGYHFPFVKGQRPPPPGTFYEAVGCAECKQLGYRGRTAIYELLMINDQVRRLCLDKADAGAIRNAAVENGMVTLRFDGARKCVLGMTTVEEVILATAEAGGLAMPMYAFKGVGANGKSTSGVRDAESPKVLRQVLRKDGVQVTSYELSKGGQKGGAKHAGGKASSTGKSGGLSRDVDLGGLIGGVKKVEIATLTRQLATLIKSGIPLAESLGALVDQITNMRLKTPMSEVRAAVNEGIAFADALSKHPKLFDELFVSMVRAGEMSGNLDEVLARLADFLEGSQKLKSKVQSAMIYPIIMVVVGAIIMFVLMIKVVPNITSMFTQSGKVLPLNTRFLIWTSNFLGDNVLWIILGTVAAVILFQKWKASKDGRRVWDRFVLRLPVVGQLARTVNISRFARTLGTMLESGVPMLRALDTGKQIIGNIVLQDAVEEAKRAVTEGESLAVTLRKSGQFPPTMIHMVAVGEKAGQLEQMLARVAETYEAEVDTKLGRLTALLEPLMLVFMGGAVAFIVFSILQPIMDLGTLSGK